MKKRGIIPILGVIIALILSIFWMKGEGFSGWVNGNGGNLFDVSSPDEFEPSHERLKWATRIDETGAEQTYQEFKTVYHAASITTQHLSAHLFGELLYEKMGISGIIVCDNTFSFGCYHSFFARALGEHGMDIAQELDRACIAKHGPMGLGCQHGIGHGILEYAGHEKFSEALDFCTRLSWKGRLFGCQGGVFMEYHFPTFFDAKTALTTMRPFDISHPYDLCPAVAQKFKYACYYEIGQWWDSALRKDHRVMGNLCDKIKDSSEKEACFLGLGTIAAQSSEYNVSQSIAACSRMPGHTSEVLCRAGAFWGFFAEPSVRENAGKMCDGLPEQEGGWCKTKGNLVENNS